VKFLQAKRVQFILDFLDLFTKENERILLLEKLVNRYFSKITEELREQRKEIKLINEQAVKQKEQLKWIDKEIKKQKRRLREFEEERDNE
tara:strand:+ start:240 stop:509 length:270 start_codon:yes stop_codon:yes gene_type:complete